MVMLRNILLGSVICLTATNSAAAIDVPPAPVPNIAKEASIVERLVPEGWRIETMSRDDLNGDRLTDAVLVIRSKDPNLIVENPNGLGEDKFDSSPRTLLVALAKKGGGFRTVAINNVIIPRIKSPTIDDPFDAISIEKNVLTLSLRFWASAGSWSMSTTSFKFRWQSDAMRLIGYDNSEIHRGSGDMTEVSVNYLTGRKITVKSSISDDDSVEVPEKIGRKPLLRLDDIGHGWEYQP